jgi:two-component system, NarL family, nitrate/nitrite response regulator NarL
MNTRLLLIDDHTLFREGAVRLLQAESEFDVVGQVGTIRDALEILRNRQVDVILLDWDLGEENGKQFMDRAHSAGFQGKVLLVTGGVSYIEAAELLKAGLAGVFMKHNPPALLIQSIREVASGKVWFEQDFVQKALGSVQGREVQNRKFTQRERHVLSLVFEGLANKEIADRLDISESSVKAALQQLFAKTGVRTRSQLVRIALEHYRDQI